MRKSNSGALSGARRTTAGRYRRLELYKARRDTDGVGREEELTKSWIGDRQLLQLSKL